MHLHILGICGTFMGGIAAVATAAGHRVTGCDADVYPPMSDQLAALGIGLTQGFGPEQLEGIAQDADVFVVGNVVSRGNPLLEAILDIRRPYTSGPQWLYENILRDKWVLAVAGTHGKTTTTAMLAWILEHAGLNPGFLVGGVPVNFGVSARLTTSAYFVVEADEYDTAFFDKRSKFVHYGPRTAVLNNLEFDHADIFADLGAIETQFHHLIRTVPRSGRLIVNGEEESLARVLARGSWSEIERFGGTDFVPRVASPPLDWQISAEGRVTHRSAPQGVVRWPEDVPQLGRHNRLNVLAALAAAWHAGVPVDVSLGALPHFRGTKRRLEARGTVRGITVYDDFAHHPTAIATTIAGLRAKVGAQRIIAIVEPRSNTMKRGVLKEALAGSLAAADRVFCYAADLGWDVAGALSSLGDRATVHDDLDALVAAVLAAARPGDSLLVMSNGGFGDIHDRLLHGLAHAR